MGVVTAHIVEEGTDVRVSFSGSILVDPNLVEGTFASFVPEPFGVVDLDAAVLFVNGFVRDFSVGMVHPSSLVFAGLVFMNVGSQPFGYLGDDLVFGEDDITVGGVGAVSEITVDPSDSFFVIGNTTLADVLGASSVDGDTLWTATTTNDTIVLSTSAPVMVPEPSSAILCFFAGIGLLRRKR